MSELKNNRGMVVLYIGSGDSLIESLSNETSLSLINKRSAVEALFELKNNSQIEAVICNYTLSGNNGIYFFEELSRNLEKLPYFILIQNGFEKEVVKTAFAIGIDDYYVSSENVYKQISKRLELLKNRAKEERIDSITTSSKKFQMPLSKRIFDVVVASTLLLLLSPLLLLVIIAIRLESKGKVYYKSKRVGQKTFDFYKLRSMRTGSDSLLKELAKENNQYSNQDQALTLEKEYFSCKECEKLPENQFCSPTVYNGSIEICERQLQKERHLKFNGQSSFIKIVNDPRITKVGKFIRNTSIDELPQLINVIKGEMSLVGNRPLPLYEAECLTEDELSKRFLAPAGITGLWQIELRGKGGKMSEKERIELDNQYAQFFIDNNYSFWYDVKLMLRTVPALLQRSTV